MNNSKGTYIFILVVLMTLFTQFCIAQKNVIIPDLGKIVEGLDWKIVNREAEIIRENDQRCIYFEAAPGDGIAWLKNFEFTNGIIEVDTKGKDVRGISYVGIAFRGVNENIYDAVYFSPFNFKSDDPVRTSNSVQYISHPDYPWQRLRTEYSGKYENQVNPVPDPNYFFHAKIIIEKPKISVYVDDGKEPCLVVEELSDRNSGWIGLWVGNKSDGTFANLRIIPQKN
ncbi:hypothetical protein ACFL6H_04280 [Candidatus Latescibacterota bacterium]